MNNKAPEIIEIYKSDTLTLNFVEGSVKGGSGDRLSMVAPVSLIKKDDTFFYFQPPAKKVYEALKKIYEP